MSICKFMRQGVHSIFIGRSSVWHGQRFGRARVANIAAAAVMSPTAPGSGTAAANCAAGSHAPAIVHLGFEYAVGLPGAGYAADTVALLVSLLLLRFPQKAGQL